MSLTGYEIPTNLHTEIDELESLISAFRNGSISEVELKARRVPFGVYEQRKRGTYMVRIRSTAGIITPSQLKRVAELSLQYASGTLHLTTRQEIQIHDVLIDNLVPLIRALIEVGLVTRGGGGNTVRNISAPWNSGIAENEIFDVAPYAAALTTAMINRGDSWLLPRKYKIAFSNSEKDEGYATVNDLGLIAQVKDGVKGFRVFVAGGMGRQSQPGHLLHDFVVESEILLITEAVKRVFSKYGNRKNKHSARLRFLWNSLGREQFIQLYETEGQALVTEGIELLKINDIQNKICSPANISALNNDSADFTIWKNRYVGKQKQAGAYWVRIPILFGMISAEKVRDIANALIPFGDNVLRFTHDQNISLRNIPAHYLPNIYSVVKRTSELSREPVLFGNAVACAGASTCQLGICRSRGALQAIFERLNGSSIDIDSINELRIHVSGCSNTCGQHMIADLGFFGKVGRKEQHSYPVYSIVAGAKLDTSGSSQLAEKIGDIDAHDLPAFIEDLLLHYSEKKYLFQTFHEYLTNEGRQYINRLLEKYKNIPSFDTDQSYYRDWGDSEIFSLEGKGTGECSAGLFDLIEIDLAKLRQKRSTILENSENNLLAKNLYELALVSSRMLLITRGAEATSDDEVFNKFINIFIKEGFVAENNLSLIEQVRKRDDLLSLKSQIMALSNEVELLYQAMDNSMQFKIQAAVIKPSQESISKDTAEVKVDSVQDFRGIACPMNFVKTKMALSKLSNNQILEISLDDGAPIENVPKLVKEEGHEILSTDKINNHWRVRIQKR